MFEKKPKKPLDERLNEYIKKCIDGSIEGALERVVVERELIDINPEYWYMIIGEDLIFDCRKPGQGNVPHLDQAFFRRLVYRLHNNLPKNFGLNFYAPRLEGYCVECSTMKYEIQNDCEFNYEHAIVQATIFGEPRVICGHNEVRPYEMRSQDELENGIDKFREVGFEPCNGYTFASYYLAYTTIFNEEPIETWVRLGIGLPLYMPTEEIEKQAWASQQKMGCTYANICDMYNPEVCKKGGCPRYNSTMHKEGFALSRYRVIRRKHFEDQHKKYCGM